MGYEVKYMPRFDAELQELYDYVCLYYADPINAAKLMNKIKKKCQALTIFPKSRVKTVRNGREFRFTYVGRHTIIYTVDDNAKEVTVRALIYAGRDIDSLLS